MTWLLAFTAAALVDFAWVFTVDSVRTQPPIQAAIASAYLFVLSGMATILYTHDKVLMIPSALGAAAGTFAAIGWIRRRDAS